MKQKIIFLLGLTLALVTSCQEETIPREMDPIVEEAAYPVNFSLSLNRFVSSTSHEPITRADGDLPLTQISNRYMVIIMKDVEGKWILDKVFENKFNPGDRFDTNLLDVTDENADNLIQFQTDLRPGNYRMSIFTGIKSMRPATDLKPGLWVEENGTAIQAFRYRLIDNGYLNPGKEGLQEEIFAGWQAFEVKKTTDLHSESLVENVHVTLDRKVGKIRMFLKFQNSDNGFYFFNDYSLGVTAQMDLVEGSQPFPSGLDIWGEPFYENGGLTTMHYGTHCWKHTQEGSDGIPYLMGMKNGTRQFAVFYFTDPSYDISVMMSDVEITASTNVRINYVYADPYSGPGISGDPFLLTLKHNSQFGIVFSPGNEEWRDPEDSGTGLRNMFLELDSPGVPTDMTDLFPYAQEYNTDGE